MFAVPPLDAVFGFGVGSIVRAVLSALGGWVASGVASLLGLYAHALNATTSVSFDAGFLAEYRVLRLVGLEFALIFVACVVIQAVVRQDLGLVARTLVVRLPAALVLSGAAVEGVALAVRATDEIARALVAGSGASFERLVSAVGVALGAASTAPVLGGFVGLALAVLLTMLALVCWVELAVRAAAIAIATLFVPLALAGLVWPATQHWARRLAELLFALVMSKVVVVAAFTLATAMLGTARGPSAVVESIALFALCAVVPFSLLRFAAFLEEGAVTHLEAAGERRARAARHGAGMAAAGVAGMVQDDPAEDGIPWGPADPGFRFEVGADVADDYRFIEPWLVVHDAPLPPAVPPPPDGAPEEPA